MLLAARLLILSAIALTGCVTAKTAAVKTFRVIDAPARYVRDRIDPPETTTSTTTQTTVSGESDVVNPGRPVTAAAPQPAPTTTQRTTATTRPSSTPRPTSSTTSRTETAATTPQPKPKPSATARTSDAAPTEFPTARPVPGKPGFVYSIDPNGGMVDVTGYKSGDKAKDPYTHQIFVVP